MTGYHMHVGYSGTYSSQHVWSRLKAAVEAVRLNRAALVAEVRRLEPGFSIDTLVPFADRYVLGDDSTLKVIDKPDPDDCQVMQLAGGGGEARDIKESMRRAFCRLVLEAMHREGLDVNLVVA